MKAEWVEFINECRGGLGEVLLKASDFMRALKGHRRLGRIMVSSHRRKLLLVTIFPLLLRLLGSLPSVSVPDTKWSSCQ